MVLVSCQSPNGSSATDAGALELDVVIRSALRSALDGVHHVCDQMAAQLAEARRQSFAAAQAVEDRIAAIQAEAESAVQRARLECQVEITALRSEVERLRSEITRPTAPAAEPWAVETASGQLPNARLADDSVERQQHIEALRQALAIARSDVDETNRRLEEEKQKHARLIEAVRSIGSKGGVFAAASTASESLRSTFEPIS